MFLKKTFNCLKQTCSNNLEKKGEMKIERNKESEEGLRILGIGITVDCFQEFGKILVDKE